MRIWSQLAGIQVSSILSIQGLQLTANYFGGPTSNAVIGLLMVIRNAVGRLNDGVSSVVFSAFATVYPHDSVKTRKLWIAATRGVAFLSLPFVLACALVPDAVGFVWLGKNGALVADWLPLVALDIGLPSLALITVQLLQLGHSRRLLLSMDVGLMALILSSVILLGMCDHAEAGWLFLAYAGWRSIYGLVLLFGPGSRVAFSRYADVLRGVIWPVLLCGIPAAVAIWLVFTAFTGWGIHLALLLTALTAGLVYIPMLWFFGLDEELRGRLHRRFGRGEGHAG
jgi:hypothetical protein